MSETIEALVRQNRTTPESPERPLGMTTNQTLAAGEAPGYGELQQQIHQALRAQHPDWVHPNGDSPLCDFYEARFAELLCRVTRPPVNKKCVGIRNFCGATSALPLDIYEPQERDSLNQFYLRRAPLT